MLIGSQMNLSCPCFMSEDMFTQFKLQGVTKLGRLAIAIIYCYYRLATYFVLPSPLYAVTDVNMLP